MGRPTLEKSRPEVNRRCTDIGSVHDECGLKHLATGETRRVPGPPELVAILHTYIDTARKVIEGHPGGRAGGQAANLCARVRLSQAV